MTLLAVEPLKGGSPAAALQRMAKHWHDLSCVYTTAVNAGNYQLLPVDAPNVPASELKAAISWIVKDMVDFSTSETTIDVLSVPHDKNTVQRNRAMYAIATRTDQMGQIQHWFEEAKLPLKVIDIPEMAQRNIASLLEPEGRAIGMISFDDKGGLLTFTGAGELFLARRIEFSMSQLASDDEQKRIGLHERIALEIQRSLDHFSRQFNWMPLAKLVVVAPGEDDGGLHAYLAQNLDTQVEALDLGSILDLSLVPQLKSRMLQHHYFLALGLALRLEEKVL